MLSLPLKDRCRVRCPNLRMCTVRFVRGIGRSVEVLEGCLRVIRGMGAYVESFTLVLEEHVCPSLATAYA